MTTLNTQIASRAAALGLAAFLTLCMLAGVNHLAVSEPDRAALIASTCPPRG